jgi:hypothetical protein
MLLPTDVWSLSTRPKRSSQRRSKKTPQTEKKEAKRRQTATEGARGNRETKTDWKVLQGDR